MRSNSRRAPTSRRPPVRGGERPFGLRPGGTRPPAEDQVPDAHAPRGLGAARHPLRPCHGDPDDPPGRHGRDGGGSRDAGGPGGHRALLEGFLPEAMRGPARVLTAPDGHRFTDSPRGFVSLLNLASVAAVETMTGAAVDPLRFRANLHLSGLAPWAELDLVDRVLTTSGGLALRVLKRTQRCAATNVDPATGQRGSRHPPCPGPAPRPHGLRDLRGGAHRRRPAARGYAADGGGLSDGSPAVPRTVAPTSRRCSAAVRAD